jgi:hypothetical protein
MGSESWEEIISNLLEDLLDLDGKTNEPWPELEHVKRFDHDQSRSKTTAVIAKKRQKHKAVCGARRSLGWK